MSDGSGYWLEQWADEYEIQSTAQYERALRSPTVLKRLHELLPSFDKHDTESHNFSRSTIMAGRSLDLSASFHHHCFGCLKIELETVVGRTFHYFENVAVSGPIPIQIAIGMEDKDPDRRAATFRRLLPHVKLINYINKIGARDRVTFLTKPSKYCNSCYRSWAEKIGLNSITDEEQSKELIAKLLETSKFVTMRNRAGKWQTQVTGPMVTKTGWMREYGRTRPTRAHMAKDLFHFLSQPGVQDRSASMHYNLPLVDTFEVSWMENIQASKAATADDVALKIKLPTLVGVDLEQLLRLQSDDSAGYLKFQNAVRTAVREAIIRYDSKSPAEIADAVVNEYIRPELSDIEQRLKLTKNNLSMKAGASVVLGATVTTVGILTAMPLIITAGIGAALTSIPSLHKYFDDGTELKTSDMYFLWKLGQVQHRD